MLLACLAFAAVCARAAGDTPVPVGHVSQLMAGEPGPVDYKDYASLLAPAMLLAHGDWAVRAARASSTLLPSCASAMPCPALSARRRCARRPRTRPLRSCSRRLGRRLRACTA